MLISVIILILKPFSKQFELKVLRKSVVLCTCICTQTKYVCISSLLRICLITTYNSSQSLLVYRFKPHCEQFQNKFRSIYMPLFTLYINTEVIHNLAYFNNSKYLSTFIACYFLIYTLLCCV